MQGIWVRRDSVRLDRLKHLDWRLKTELDQHRATTDGVVGRNSNLESVDGFAGDALIYFRVKDPAEFSTIMGELLG
ncbi:hypothetical protein [Maricaulis sp.]|nr:hypothetical protein [Maricaulis sp.]MBO6876551.1 hypothetical protein [Maricaulis sp.]